MLLYGVCVKESPKQLGQSAVSWQGEGRGCRQCMDGCVHGWGQMHGHTAKETCLALGLGVEADNPDLQHNGHAARLNRKEDTGRKVMA